MARQTLNLGPFDSGSVYAWNTPGGADYLIDSAFFDHSNPRHMVHVGVSIGGTITLYARGTPANASGAGERFSSQFEAHGTVTIGSGDLSFVLNFPIASPASAYAWTPTNSAEVVTFVFAHNPNDDVIIILDDHAGTVPVYADPTGDDQMWRVGVPIVPFVAPDATGIPDPTYAVTGALPGGVLFNVDTQTFSGTPTAAGSGTVTITATNDAGSATWTYDYVIQPAFAAPMFADNTGVTRTWTAGVPITPVVIPTASGNPLPGYTIQGPLPEGIVYAVLTRTLSGTPVNLEAGTITARATNSQGSDFWAFDYETVAPLAAPIFPELSGEAVSWVVGEAIETIAVPIASGNPTPVYSSSGRPAGILFNTSTGEITGTPTGAGSGTITITATNSQGASTWTIIYVTSRPLTVPAQPAAPTVFAINNIGLRVTGVAPFNGNDRILNYDWRYKKTTDVDWIDRFDQTNLTQIFPDLELATAYEIQFRATNTIGNSSYSESGRGVTQATIAPTGIVDTSASPGTGVVYRAVISVEGSMTLYDNAGTSVIISGASQLQVSGDVAIAIDQIQNVILGAVPGALDQNLRFRRLSGDASSYEISQWQTDENILATKTWWLVTDDAFVAISCAVPAVEGQPGFLSAGTHFWNTKQSQEFAAAINMLEAMDTVLLICADTDSILDTRAGTVPGLPRNLRAVASIATSSQISLFWQEPINSGGADITGYRIEVSEDAGDTWENLIADTMSTDVSYVHTGLPPVTRRYYRIYAINTNGESGPSGVADAITNTALTGTTIEQAFPAELSIISNDLWLLRPVNALVPVWQFNQLLVASGNALFYYALIIYTNGQVGLRPSGAVDTVNNPNSYEFLEIVENDMTLTITSVDASGTETLIVTDLPDLLNGEYLWTPINETDVVAFNAAVRAQTDPTTNVVLNFQAAAVAARVPGVTGELTLAPGDRLVELSWSAPSDDGGGALLRYEYKINAEDWVSTGGTTPTHVVRTLADTTRLLNGTAYSFSVRAVNIIGAGPTSAVVMATPRTVPDAPTDPVAVPGNASIALSWTAPANNNGAAILHYEYRLNGGAWIATRDATLSTNIRSLVNGQEYGLEARAVNEAGGGAATGIILATPRTIPQAPTELTAEPGNRRMRLSWVAPEDTGGSVITRFEYQVDDNAWVTTGGIGTFFTVPGLTNGQAYEFRIRAVNVAGSGIPSEAVPGTPETVAQAPTNLVVDERNRQILLTWTPPVDTGGFPILNYEYEIDGSGDWVSTQSANAMYLFSGFMNGTLYAFRVRAITAAANPGNASISINGRPRTVPTAPRQLTGIVGNRRILLEWMEPQGNGGANITGYEYKVDNADWVSTGSLNLTLLLTMLMNGQAYTLAIRAVNIAGAGPSSPLIVRTPYTRASGPGAFTVTPGDMQVILTWTTPDNGGSPITDYEYSINNGVWIPITEVVLVLTLTQFINGQSYSFRTRAVTLAGGGLPSASVSATPRTIPGPVRNFSVLPLNVSVRLTWIRPLSTGGARITDYEYQVDDAAWVSFASTATTGVVIGLANGQEYMFAVRAVNIAGGGESSTIINGTPRTVPNRPTGLVATAASDTQINLKWVTPANNGGARIIGYKIEIGESANVFEDLISNTEITATEFSVTGLAPETQRFFRVSAINEAGTSAVSDVANTRTTVRMVTDIDITVGVFDRQPGYSFVYREEFIDIIKGRTGALANAAVNALNYEYSIMDNVSEFALRTNIDFHSDRGVFIKGMFLGNVNFESMSIFLYSDINFTMQIGETLTPIIVRDPRDGLHKHWIIFNEATQLQAIQGIRIVPGDIMTGATAIQIGSIVFARNIHTLPKQPRQGLGETVEPETIKSGPRTLSYGSSTISQRPTFRVTVIEAAQYSAFVRRTAGKIFLVYDGGPNARNEGHTAFYARRTSATRTTKRLHVEISFDLQGVV